MKNFDELSEKEILALAISLEEDDERIYADFAEGFRQDFPATAAVFDGMRAEESGHRRRLIEHYRQRFGEHIPLIRRQDAGGAGRGDCVRDGRCDWELVNERSNKTGNAPMERCPHGSG